MSIYIPQYKGFKQNIILFDNIEDMSPVEIILPDPPNKTKVINNNRATANQLFERIPLPVHFNSLRKLPKEEIQRKLTKDDHTYILDQYNKIENGHWFYNNGELTYITGAHYLFLNWWQIDIGYPDYRDVNRRYYLHWQKIENDPNAFGMVEFTRRRDGKSHRSGCIAYHRTFMYKNRNCGIQSKTDVDAEKYFQKTIVSPWRKLPFFLHPNFNNPSNPKKELSFYAQATRGKAAGQNLMVEDELESVIEVKSSVESAFDGYKLHTSIDDEAGKMKDVDILERWRIKRTCLTEEVKIIGKELMTSTVGDMDSGGGDRFEEIWKDSDQGKLDITTGQTKSGLHRHFTPAYDGYIIDKYGRSLIEESKKRLEAERALKKGKPRDLSEHKRQYPMSVKEAFRSSQKDCHFNKEKIEEQLEKFVFSNPNVRRGNFLWKDGIPDTQVIFKENPNGKFIISWLYDDPNDASRWKTSGNIKSPQDQRKFTAGSDSFKFNETEGTRKSMGAGAVFLNRDESIDTDEKDISLWETNRYVCTYVNRPNLYEYLEDMLLMCVYYGAMMFAEGQVDHVIRHFQERGYGGYLLYDVKADGRRKTNPGAHTFDGMKQRIFGLIDDYVDNHIHREVHEEVLNSFLEVQFESLTKYDLFVACGYAIVGSQINKYIPVRTGVTPFKFFHEETVKF